MVDVQVAKRRDETGETRIDADKRSLTIFSHWKLTQQQVLTVIWMVFLPGWQTCFRYKGRWVFLFSPRSISNGVELADTWTLAGQFVFICRSSWWKHFSCSSRSDRHMSVLYTVGLSWNTWLLTAKLCSRRNGGRMIPSRTGKVSLSSSPKRKLNFKSFHLTTERLSTHCAQYLV